MKYLIRISMLLVATSFGYVNCLNGQEVVVTEPAIFQIIQDGTPGCWIEAKVNCANWVGGGPWSTCATTTCELVDVTIGGQIVERWSCVPLDKEFSVAQNDEVSRLGSNPEAWGQESFENSVSKCGNYNKCGCPEGEPTPEQLANPPKCEATGNPLPGVEINQQKPTGNVCPPTTQGG